MTRAPAYRDTATLRQFLKGFRINCTEECGINAQNSPIDYSVTYAKLLDANGATLLTGEKSRVPRISRRRI